MKIIAVILLTVSSLTFAAEDPLKILTWEGYVTTADIININTVLAEKGYAIKAEVIQPFASGPKQMFNLLRQNECDISFLTLNYIKMQNGKLTSLLQSIDVDSPRLSHYKTLRPELTHIPMGVVNNSPLYIPFGGGAYGIWANMKHLKREDIPKSIKELWLPKWQGKLSLTSGQIQPNIALVMLAMDMPPYHINDLLNLPESDAQLFSNRREAITISRGQALQLTTQLYRQVPRFWDGVPDYGDDILLTASYGVEIAQLNQRGGQWEFVSFVEGSTTWLDTINFSKSLKGKRLEAAEIVANYFLSKTAQTRIVTELGMVAASTLVDSNPLLDANPAFFSEYLFWPPYNSTATNIMNSMSDKAMKAAQEVSSLN